MARAPPPAFSLQRGQCPAWCLEAKYERVPHPNVAQSATLGWGFLTFDCQCYRVISQPRDGRS